MYYHILFTFFPLNQIVNIRCFPEIPIFTIWKDIYRYLLSQKYVSMFALKDGDKILNQI